MSERPDNVTELAPYCECVGSRVREHWQHAPDCPRWAPPARGPGSTPAARVAALAAIRAQIAEARRRRQEQR